jgi:hypothetical protein
MLWLTIFKILLSIKGYQHYFPPTHETGAVLKILSFAKSFESGICEKRPRHGKARGSFAVRWCSRWRFGDKIWGLEEFSYFFCEIYEKNTLNLQHKNIWTITYNLSKKFIYHGSRNYWYLCGLRHLCSCLPRWSYLWRRHLPHRSRYLHWLRFMRRSLPHRCYQGWIIHTQTIYRSNAITIKIGVIFILKTAPIFIFTHINKVIGYSDIFL